MGTTTTSWVDNVGTMVGEHHRELGLLGVLLSSTFSMVSIVGYSPDDPTLLHPGAGEVVNPCGPLGALISDSLFTLVGYGAWATFGGMVLAVLALAGRQVLQLRQVMMGMGLGSVVLAGTHLALRPGTDFPPGGVIGAGIAETLESLIGTFGAWIVVFGGLLVAVTVVGQIRWSLVVQRLADVIGQMLPPVQGLMQQVGSAAGRGTSTLARSASSKMAGAASAATARSVRTVQRMGRSLARSDEEPPLDDEEGSVVESSVLEAFDSDAGSMAFGPPSAVDATAVGEQVALAEVEWDSEGSSSASSEVLGLFPELTSRPSVAASRHDVSSIMDLPTRASDDEDELGMQIPPSLAEPSFVQPSSVLEADDLPPPVVAAPSSVPPAATPVVSAGRVHAPDRPIAGAQIRPADNLDAAHHDDGDVLVKRKSVSFQLPKLSLLDVVPPQKAEFDSEELRQMATRVEETLSSFKVTGEVTDVRVGPVVTTFEFVPTRGISVKKVAKLGDDLAMSLKALSVRIVAPIPGKGCVGVEVPSPQRLNIYLRELMASQAFRDSDMALPMVLGKDVEGQPIVADLAKMPHLLVGGTTGAGKSVGVNGMLMSMLFTRSPDELRLLLVDPKKLEFKLYEDIPHLIHPVVTEPNKAAAALAWACREMDQRYELLAHWETRNIANYNAKVDREMEDWTPAKERRYAPADYSEGRAFRPEKLPYIVIVIDELADLMLVAKKEVEGSIARLTQMARACGIHIIVATQRPSVDVITGLIKSNLPTRISFKLRTGTDSRTILDAVGAENLLGRGDMLYLPNGADILRCHGAFVSDDEVGRVAQFWRDQAAPRYIEGVTKVAEESEDLADEEVDSLYDDALAIVVAKGKASTSMIQRHLKIGYNRAARIVDQMEARGAIGPSDGARPREVLI